MNRNLLISLLFSCVQCICVFFLTLLLSCTLVKMFNLDLSNSQYDFREELGVYDCKYLEIENLEKSKKGGVSVQEVPVWRVSVQKGVSV